MRRDGRWHTPAALAVLALLLAGITFAGCGRMLPVAAGATGCGPGWAAGWHAAQQAVPGDQLAGRTLRMVVRPQASGDELRLRLSNRHGDGPLHVGSVTVGRTAAGAGTTEPRPVSTGGRSDVRLEPGTEVLTDPLPVPVERGVPLTVSLYLAQVPATISSHPVAMRTAWLSGPGDRSAEPGADGFGTTLQSWPVLAGLDVLAPRPVGGVLVIGDSIVDGVGSTPNGDDRFSDALAARPASGEGATTVLNAGLSRNQLLQDDPPAGGDAPGTRFDVDVEPLAGIRDVILLIGTNDLAAGAGEGELVAGLQAFADRARASGLRVFLSTIPPSTSGGRDAEAVVATRDRVNERIRTEGPHWADGVIDAAAALADPGDPTRLRPDYDSGDGLHPSPAGYRALAAAVPVGALSGAPCPAPASG
ncbi:MULTISPECIES: GDSL-type esterase/lipase family protein [Pseudonocardia]|uniref:GDSL-like Lipase/Acylhydrolase n=2 Tax=Pseudonocardia TaxID=1847 RepID=A0A1Y2MJA6_PSEAH|nr:MULTISPECIES: GDSL-type esterase/lipase family protein [Pseudonocardia]OSY35343.1 GDSL-like Lipase/Acylhydrolase [Pseudonocardia autotrophica]TDN75491.1 lysophospholipase L1-like esterase [Pseudonocardia autotrophica]BBF99457.1 SGNH hydrolase [Pseudonocardia autotrophica]GEC29315.1 SGNH hydrolase [Pseudonocardia saturnea]